MTAGRGTKIEENMEIYTTIIVLAVIIAICYLANVYVSTKNWNKDKLLLKIGLDDIDTSLRNIKLVLESIDNFQKVLHKDKEEEK